LKPAATRARSNVQVAPANCPALKPGPGPAVFEPISRAGPRCGHPLADGACPGRSLQCWSAKRPPPACAMWALRGAPPASARALAAGWACRSKRSCRRKSRGIQPRRNPGVALGNLIVGASPYPQDLGAWRAKRSPLLGAAQGAWIELRRRSPATPKSSAPFDPPLSLDDALRLTGQRKAKPCSARSRCTASRRATAAGGAWRAVHNRRLPIPCRRPEGFFLRPAAPVI